MGQQVNCFSKITLSESDINLVKLKLLDPKLIDLFVCKLKII